MKRARIVGLLTMENISEMIMINGALAHHDTASRGGYGLGSYARDGIGVTFPRGKQPIQSS